MTLKPLKMLENRVWRIYLGGYLLDKHRGQEGKDGYFPEDWLASVVSANNPPRPDTPEREGLSRVSLPDGSIAYLKDLIDADPENYLGKDHIEKFGVNFGVLTKFLDSAERLPIQVHPDKQIAKSHFNSDYGKTEAWCILNGREINGDKPHIFLGFKENVTVEQWKELFDKQDIEGMTNLMHKVYVKPGEVYIIEGGTAHAIGAGCFLLEIQEPTDYTISMEKCNMLGEPLPDMLIHQGIGFEKMFDCFHYVKHTLPELLDAFKLEPATVEEDEAHKIECLISYDRTTCFSLNKITVNSAFNRPMKGTPCALTVVAGSGKIGDEDVVCGDCLFVPAMTPDFEISGEMTLLECLPPKK